MWTDLVAVRRALLLLSAAVLAVSAGLLTPTPAAAQATDGGSDLLNPSPRGLVDVPPRAAAPAAPASAPVLPPTPLRPLPPEPSTASKPLPFGSQLFSGRFAGETLTSFNPDYRIATGDRISVRMWGAFNFEAPQRVDAQGNIFLPNVGPVAVRGVRNVELNPLVEAQVKRTFRSSVGVYATLDAAQPVKVYVTGFVRAPGLYGGVSSDSVLAFLDRAGGIDPARGSYRTVEVLRGGQSRAKFDLYQFLLDGQIQPLQLQDGDAVVVGSRGFTAQVGGEVLNPYVFELDQAEVPADRLLALAKPKPGATHLSIVRRLGTERRSEYHPLGAAAQVTVRDGDEITLTSDKVPGTILVRLEGAHLGERTLVLPYGARLSDALARLRPAPQADTAALQLFRRSVAERQQQLLESSLRSLETYALTARSATSEEAALRTRESQLILEYIDRARRTQPQGQVVLGGAAGAGETLLEDGDVIRVPEKSNLVLVSGEVLFPNALVFDRQAGVDSYITRAGGFTQGADRSRVMLVRQDGSVEAAERAEPHSGDVIMVLPKIETKNVEVARGITQIIYQTAVAARIALGL